MLYCTFFGGYKVSTRQIISGGKLFPRTNLMTKKETDSNSRTVSGKRDKCGGLT